jgi:hypothetical protein
MNIAANKLSDLKEFCNERNIPVPAPQSKIEYVQAVTIYRDITRDYTGRQNAPLSQFSPSTQSHGSPGISPAVPQRPSVHRDIDARSQSPAYLRDPLVLGALAIVIISLIFFVVVLIGTD